MGKKHMLIGLVGIVVGVLLASVVVVLAGTNFDAPSGPTDSASQMYTLEQVYDRINDGTAAISMTTFTEPASGPAATMYDLNALYTLVSERSRPAKTGQTTSSADYDDGYYEKGVTWPNPRFTKSNGTVTDNLTGLIWLENANCFGRKKWQDGSTYPALEAALTLNSGECGLTDSSVEGDWRLPNVRELFSLIDSSQPTAAPWVALPSGHPFSGVQSNYYWSSTTYAHSTVNAWYVSLYDGVVDYGNETCTYYVWPVRGGQ